MNLKKQLLASVCVMAAVGVAGNAYAQDTTNEENQTIKTRAVTLEGTTESQQVYSMGKGIDSGKTTFNQEAVQSLSSGTGDVNEILRALPHVEFNKDSFGSDRDSLIDIRPLDISISGGQAYDNNIQLDGINIASHMPLMNTSEASAAHYDNVASSKSQFQWVDSSLVGEVELFDSNVSAEYGDFTGGVLKINTRAPKGKLGIEASSSCTSTDLTSFRVNKKTRASLGLDDYGEDPEYTRCNLGLNIDLPTIAGWNILLTQQYEDAEYRENKNANYGGTEYYEKSISRTTMIKAQKALSDFALLDIQVAHAPYITQYEGTTAANNRVTTHGSGDRATIKLNSINSKFFGSEAWNFEVNYNYNDGGRDAPGDNYSWPSTSLIYECGATTCTQGGFGNIKQEEKDLDVKANATWALPIGKLRAGLVYGNIDARKQRLEDNAAYRAKTGSSTTISSNTVCLDADDEACIDGVGALEYKIVYTAYDAHVTLDSGAAYAEWSADFGKLSTRIGGRVDYESFLGNTNFAPRLSASYNFGPAILTLGANRYYSASFLDYALNEQKPDTLAFTRNVTIVNGERQYSNEWTQTLGTKTTRFSDANLDTPYSDELAAALNFRLPHNIDTRIKYILREGKDEFSYENAGKESYTNYAGKTATYTIYKPNNDATSHYEAISAEFTKTFNKNLSAYLNLAWSETRRDNYQEYLEAYSEEDLNTLVYYNGEVVSLAQINEKIKAANFATPFKINLGMRGKFFNDTLNVSAVARWTDSYTSIDDLGTNTKVDGTNYDDYGKVKYESMTTFDLHGKYTLINSGGITATIEADALNLFDKVQGSYIGTTSQPYQKGRTIWLGLRVKY